MPEHQTDILIDDAVQTMIILDKFNGNNDSYEEIKTKILGVLENI